jgi:hypothetical protein
MKKTLSTVALSVSLSSALLVGVASAATPTPNGACSPAGSKTTIAAKNYVCAKVLSGKTVWILGMGVGTLRQNPTAPKPAISGSAGRGFGEESEGGRQGEEHSGVNGINSAAMKKFNDCLVKHGGSVMSPRSSAVQKKAVAACSALEPKFIRHSGEDD